MYLVMSGKRDKLSKVRQLDPEVKGIFGMEIFSMVNLDVKSPRPVIM